MNDLYIPSSYAKKTLKTILGYFYYRYLMHGYSDNEIFSKNGKLGNCHNLIKRRSINIKTVRVAFEEFVQNRTKINFDFYFFKKRETRDFLTHSYKYIRDLPECSKYILSYLNECKKVKGNEAYLYYLLKDFQYIDLLLSFISKIQRQKTLSQTKLNINSNNIQLLEIVQKVLSNIEAYNLPRKLEELALSEKSANQFKQKTTTYLTAKYLRRYKWKQHKTQNDCHDVVNAMTFLDKNIDNIIKIIKTLSSSRSAFTFDSSSRDILEKIESFNKNLSKLLVDKDFVNAMHVYKHDEDLK